MKITTIGIDLAKSVFQIHGVDERGNKVLGRKMRRDQLLPFFGQLPPCLIGMEAAGSSHHWGRKLQALGHTVKLMAPQYVKPYVKTNKSDARDAEAICEAVTRPNMRFVPIKNVEQQTILSLHRARHRFIRSRTAQTNQIRGLLAEFGIVIAKGIQNIPKRLPVILADQANELPEQIRCLMQRLLEHLKYLNEQVNQLERQITLWHRQNEDSRRLADTPGIGPMTASALVATIGNANDFRNGRHLSAWVGLVPKQQSTGGKNVLLGISKHGNTYLRTLLVHGARAVLRALKAKPPTPEVTASWLWRLATRVHYNKAVVALANKNVRTAWALLAHGRRFEPDYKPVAPIVA